MALSPPTISTDSLLTLLADSQRRRILGQLLTSDGETSVEALVDSCFRVDSANTPHAEWAAAAHHNHLPRLEALNVVDLDARRDIVGRGVNFDEATSLLCRIAAEREDVSVCGC